MKNTVKIGICGRSGSGKSYVCSVFESFGGYHIDKDAVYHKLLEPSGRTPSPCASEIARAFGEDLLSDGKLDRKALGAVVFSDPGKLKKLNRIAHRYILDETRRLIEATDAPFVLIDAPVLFESGFDKFCDFTVCVVANEATCVWRIVKRDGITKAEARRRLASQIPSSKLRKMCDRAVNNSLGRDVTKDVEKILRDKGLIKDEC